MKLLVAIAASLLGAVAVSAQVPAGGEIQVNVTTSGDQTQPVIASDPSGRFVVAWSSPFLFSTDIVARRYGAAGAPIGSEFQVNAVNTSGEAEPAIATDAHGNFVVAWDGYDGSGSSAVIARRFTASGDPRENEFRVNTFTPNVQAAPSVAMAPGGQFVVAWESDNQDGSGRGIFAQRYAPSGAPVGGEFQVNTHTMSDQIQPAVAVDATGRFIVAWTSFDQDGDREGVFAQRFSPSGAALGAEFRVNSSTFLEQYRPGVAADPAGNFVVAWTWRDYVGGPGPITFPTRIMAQRYDATGATRGGEFAVSPFTMRAVPSFPSSAVSTDAAGNFVVAWSGQPYSASVGPAPVFARRYDGAGAPRGATLTVNSFTPDDGSKYTSVASDAAGNFVVAWKNSGQDGSGDGVFAQRFGGLQPVAIDVDSMAVGGSDANGILEPGETVDVRPSWHNVSGAPQTFDGTAIAFTGPPAPGVSYLLPDASCAYGSVPDDTTIHCFDIYSIAVGYGGVRPALHWDTTFTERLTPDILGQTKPWPIHVGDSFTDVPRTSTFYRSVETVLHNGVTAGCASGSYCPQQPATREQMAAFVLTGKEGAGYAPASCVPPDTFADVPNTSPFCAVIEELARRGVVSGCGGGNYCPASAVTRDQMAVFVLRTLEPTSVPPPCAAPMFGDVPASSPFCRWVEELARRGVVTGCGGGNYCPAAPVTREQMAVFVTATFGLALYGP